MTVGSNKATKAAGKKSPADKKREKQWSLASAIILSLATLAAAWCGYQAANWGGVYSVESRTANGERFEEARLTDVANRQMISDLMIYSTWFEAEISGDTALADEIEARFLSHFKAGFEAWRNLPVAEGTQMPPGSPFNQPEYVLPSQQAADAADLRALEALDAADVANEASGHYVLTSVLFASVLFLAGIASKLPNRKIRHGVIGVAGVVLAAALWFLITAPVTF